MRNPDEDFHRDTETGKPLERKIKMRPIFKQSHERTEHATSSAYYESKGPLPEGMVVFTVGEIVQVKGCDYEVLSIGQKRLTLKPVKPESTKGRTNA